MRKLFIVLAIIFTVLGIIFTILPLGTLALLPLGIALLTAFLAFRSSDLSQKTLPKWILIIAGITLAIVVCREAFTKDEVIADKQFDQKKIESKEEAKKDLEELEGLE